MRSWRIDERDPGHPTPIADIHYLWRRHEKARCLARCSPARARGERGSISAATRHRQCHEYEGQPIGNVVVNVQGTALGTYTADDGKFVLNNVPNSAQMLVVRRIGYRRVLQPLAANVNQIDIQLVKDVLELERRSSLELRLPSPPSTRPTPSRRVSGEQLNKAPTPTIENALQGKVPGAVISQNSGAPGGGTQVQIRGTTSINANSSPLYVVDGVIVSNASILNGLNSITAAGGGDHRQPGPAGQPYRRPQPGGHREHRGPQGRLGRRHLRLARVERRHRHHDQARPRRPHDRRASRSASASSRCRTSSVSAASAPPPRSPPLRSTPPRAEFTAAQRRVPRLREQFYGDNPLSYETDLSMRGGNGGTTFYVSGLAKRDNGHPERTLYKKQSLSANLAS